MPTVFDSKIFGDLFSTAEMRAIFSDENLIQKWIDVEVALALVQGDLGIIKKDAADEIAAKGKVGNMDMDEIRKGIKETGHPLVPLLRIYKHACQGDAGEYLHWGATTQDVMDTGMILQLKEADRIIRRDILKILGFLGNIAEAHKNTIMAGRTHGQHALPITFGYKVAVWCAELDRHLQRLDDCQNRVFQGQFSGAVGTLASLPELGREVQKGLFKRLDLFEPLISWHTSRDGIAEYICVLGMISSTFEKIGKEIVALQKTEVSELEEPFVMGKVGSSTMPHKRNPMITEGFISCAKIIRKNAALSLETMVGEHERDMGSWQAEWQYIPETCLLMSGLLNAGIVVFQGLKVNVAQMEKNLNILQGLILSESVMLKLGQSIGRQRAHDIVYKCSMEAFEKGIPLAQVLKGRDEVIKHLGPTEIDNVLSPREYLGLAEYFTGQVIGKMKTRHF